MEYFKEKSILITGASGFIASEILYLLKDIDCKIYRLSRKRLNEVDSDNATIINLCLEDYQSDLCDLKLPHLDIVFHLAAQTSIYDADKNPLQSFDGNLGYFARLLNYLKAYHMGTSVILASTVTIFGVQDPYHMDESFNDKPSTLYDYEKQYMERYLSYFVEKKWLKGGSLRLSNVYGAGKSVSSHDRNVICKIIGRYIKNESISLFGGGNFIRDYIHVSDVVSAFLAAGVFSHQLKGKNYIISSGRGLFFKEAVDIIYEKVKTYYSSIKKSVHSAPNPDYLLPIEFRNFVGKSTLFYSITDWVSEVSFEAGIEQTVASYYEAHNV